MLRREKVQAKVKEKEKVKIRALLGLITRLTNSRLRLSCIEHLIREGGRKITLDCFKMMKNRRIKITK